MDPIFAFARASIEGRRVALMGKGAREAASTLAEFGPRMVMAFDPDVDAPFDTLRPLPITVRPLADADFDVRSGAFDSIFVCDLESLPPLHRMLPRMRKVLTENGVLFATAKLREGALTYEELYEFFSMQFEHMKMLGVLPFHGVSFVELGAEDPDVSVDTEFASQDPPTQLLVCASAEPIETEAYAIVATEAPMPKPSLSEAQTMAFSMAPPPASGHEAEIASLTLRTQMLQTQLEDARHAAQQHRVDDGLAQRVEALESDVQERERRLAASEDRAREYATEAQRLRMEVERLRDDVGKREREARELTVLLEARTEAEAAEAAKTETVKAETVTIQTPVDDDLTHQNEVLALETALAERAAELSVQRAEVTRLGKLVKELVLAQELVAPVSSAGTELHGKLDALAHALALAHAEIEAQRWAVQEPWKDTENAS
jgi:hypothetical protein